MDGNRALGVGLLIVGGLAVGFAGQIQELGLGQNADPGPRALPMLLGAVLILGGVFEMALWLLRRNRAGVGIGEEGDVAEAVATAPSYRPLILMVAGVTAYVVAIGMIGFTLSSFVFATAMMGCLGIRWWVAGLTSVGLLVVVQGLFTYLFRVQLPRGMWELPF